MRAPLALAALALLAFPLAGASNPNLGNWPSALDGYTTGCGGFAPVTLTCSATLMQIRSGHAYSWDIQFCDYNTPAFSYSYCGPGDSLIDATIHLRLTSPTVDERVTCQVGPGSAGAEPPCTTTRTGGFYVGDDVQLTGSVTPLDGPVPVGYWRVVLIEEP